MALPRRGSRRLVVDGRTYRWLIRKEPTYGQGAFESPMTMAIEQVDLPGVLVVELVVSRPDNWISPHQTAVKPSTVRAIIHRALEAGWRPDEGGSFELRYPLIRDQA